MSYILRNGCKLCKNLQYVHRVPKNWYYQFYSKSNSLARGITSCQNLYASKPSPSVDKSLYESYVLAERLPEIEEVIDEHLLDSLNDTMKNSPEMEKFEVSSEVSDLGVNDTKTVTRRKRKQKKNVLQAKYEKGNQLTLYGEQNVLAEIDIYVYLGELSKAEKLFNFHRRCGHRFSIDVYNRMINVLALQNNWKKIQYLLKNMKTEKLEPTYQTYAALLEACGNVSYDVSPDVEDILSEMSNRNMNVRELFQKAHLTKQQIESIRYALSFVNGDVFDDRLDEENPLQNFSLTNSLQSQIDKELVGTLSIKSIETPKVFPLPIIKRSNLYKSIIQIWRENFILEMRKLRSAKDNNDLLYNRCVTYCCVLTPEEIADIVFYNIVPLIASQQKGLQVSFICRLLGRMVYNKFCMKFKEDKGVVEKLNSILERYLAPNDSGSSSILPREKWENISSELCYLASENVMPTPWSMKIKVMASSVILDTLQKIAVVDTSLFLRNHDGEIEKSLFHGYEITSERRKRGMLRFHPAICRLYSSDLSHVGNLSFEVESLPMTIPPKPWLTPKSGGYLFLHSNFIRILPGVFRDRHLPNKSEHNMDDLLDAVSYIGNCAWKVNGKLLDLMIELFNGKGDPNLDIIGTGMMAEAERNMKKKRASRKEMELAKKEYHELYALRMDLLYKLSVANHFRNDVLWNPNNLDFRGRIYPLAPHCSHIGNDVCRSMLMFAHGKKLGERGLDWLKVNLVNVHGQLKKASLEDRIKYANEHLDDIMDSADNPFNGRKWWQKGSEPWQTLITCMEVTDAIRSGDPPNFISHLPTQQDGSCNGLQHYAALGRDAYGAKQVNLSPSDRPQDIYAEVSNLVEKKREEDAANGDVLAQQLVGKINRKVVKQTVMTVVYGVTFIGGRLQIEKQLKELNVDKDIIFQASIYIVQLVFSSISQMFTSARQIQDWLTVASVQISLTGNCVDWVTPLNLYVIQPYHKKAVERVSTPIQNTLSFTHQYDYTRAPNLRKQKGGFPPNFIHSLDSTHMLMTALRCQKENMVFASVHDSFWTHAADTDKLNRFCREEFINLHKLPILVDLKKHFDAKFSGLPLRQPLKDGRTECQFDDLPQLGEFDIENVLKSVYFFS